MARAGSGRPRIPVNADASVQFVSAQHGREWIQVPVIEKIVGVLDPTLLSISPLLPLSRLNVDVCRMYAFVSCRRVSRRTS